MTAKRRFDPDARESTMVQEMEALLAQSHDKGRKAMPHKKTPPAHKKTPHHKGTPKPGKASRAKGVRDYVERVQKWGKAKIHEIEGGGTKKPHHKKPKGKK